jgi:hypothetical protein
MYFIKEDDIYDTATTEDESEDETERQSTTTKTTKIIELPKKSR